MNWTSISHGAGLEALCKWLSERDSLKAYTEDIIRMADFVLRNIFLNTTAREKRQKSATAIGAKLVSPYACIFMDEVETEFLKSQGFQPFRWLRYYDDMFFIWTDGEQSSFSFLMNLVTFVTIWNLHMKPSVVQSVF